MNDENESVYPEFTADDLRANARGILTDAQRERLIGMMIPARTVVLLFSIFIIATPVCMNWLLLKSVAYISPFGWVNGLNVGIILLFGAAFIASWPKRIAYLRELDTTTVVYTEGVIRKENLYQWGNYHATKLSVGEVDFLTHIALTKAFKVAGVIVCTICRRANISCRMKSWIGRICMTIFRQALKHLPDEAKHPEGR